MGYSPRRLAETVSFLLHHEGFRRAPLRRLSRAGQWLVLRALNRYPEVRISRWGATYRLPRIARGPGKVFYVFEDDYEPEVRIIEALIKPGAVFADVGANFGLFTIMASRLVGESGRVFAFEPFPPAIADLEENISRNKCRNVTVHRCALSNVAGSADLFIHDDPGRNTLGDLGTAGTSTVSVPLKKLDEVLANDGLSRLDFIKMDVEGAEELVLRGGVESLRRFRPMVAFEMNGVGPPRFGLHPQGAWNFLAENDYRFFDFTMQGLVPIEAPASANALAVPKECDAAALPMA